jgi:hypothetical protein
MKLKNGMALVATTIALVVVGGPVVASDGKPDSKIGLAVMAGGGVTDFTQGATRDHTAMGGSWDLRALIATRTWIGFEGSYIGGANPIKALGLSGNSKLVRNGVEAAVRVQIFRQTILGSQGATGLSNWDTGAMIGFEF